MPQLNPEFFISQLFWLAVFFTFLFIFLWRVSLPRIATVLAKRQNKIDENLSYAKELQEQAQKIEKNINIQINNAKEQTDEEIKKTISSLQDDMSDKLALLDKELNDKISKSEKEIQLNKNNQMKNINSEIANITKITIDKIVDLDIPDGDIKKVIEAQNGVLN
tara:strand:- start:236 stop:727 length:492 start_codon:yes stop_codon:yes gene_type:complete